MQYIFIHGLGQNPSSWDKTISLMPERINTVCPDLISMLGDNEITYENLYRSFAAYCNDISEPLNLCGLSLGGVLALNYAINYPAKVHSLVLIAAQYKMPKTLLKLQNLVFKVMPESVFKNMGFQKKDMIRLTNSMINLDFGEGLKNLSCKTLILCGAKDSANKKAAMGLAANITGANLKFIENASHEVNKDSPEKLAAELEIFYKG